MTATSPLFILYGSATGNAEHIAKDLAASYQAMLGNPDVDTFFSSVICAELDHYKKKCEAIWNEEPTSSQRKHGVLIVTSTTGNGDAPENASRFVRFIKRKTTVTSQPFKNCAYAVLALGDTNYDQFCNAGKIVDKKMAELGGQQVTPLVCADEATGLEDAVDPWVDSILTKITAACRIEGLDGRSSHTTTSANETTTSKNTLEEEKKSELNDDCVTDDFPDEKMDSCSSPGVLTVKSIIGSQARIPKIASSAADMRLSSATRFSSCVLVDDEIDGSTASARPRSDSVTSTDSSGTHHFSYRNPFHAPVVAARYLTQTPPLESASTIPREATDSIRAQFSLEGKAAVRNSKRVIEITLNLPDQHFEYVPGDAIGMIVENSAPDVAFILGNLQKHHGLRATQKICLDGETLVTVEAAVKRMIDLTWFSIRNKRVLLCLAQNASGEEKHVLEWLSSAAGAAVYDTFIVQQQQSVVDLMKEFPSLQGIALESLLGILPPLAPRYYSISSSPLVSRNSLTIALAVVDYLTPSFVVNGKELGKRRIGGLASQYLEALVSPFLVASPQSIVPSSIPIFPKPTDDFKLPDSRDTPLILVGPGTGVAPFVGFLQHRRALLADGYGSKEGSIDLFFGCRHRDHDFLYQNELEDLLCCGVLTRLHKAFSRETSRKEYVQDLITQCEAESVKDLILQKRAAVYICGDGNHMAKGVQRAIQSILEESLGSTQEAHAYMTRMKEEKRLLLDIWS